MRSLKLATAAVLLALGALTAATATGSPSTTTTTQTLAQPDQGWTTGMW